MNYSSDAFWSFSLREWQAAMKGYVQKNYGHQSSPMRGSRLQELMEQYPDDRPID
ncbi:phage tail assembly chaperone protein [Caudoviricetes sp.]|nr:phage tail assembly chaperone protein [Caudoviricetes sp.]